MILLPLEVMYETDLHIDTRRAGNREGKRTLAGFKRSSLSKGKGDPNRGEGHISQLHYCGKAEPPGSLPQELSYQSELCLLKVLFLLQK